MTAIDTVTRRARQVRSFPQEVRARLIRLEAEIQEQRQLSRRVAELTDLVTELLVPLAEDRPEQAAAIVRRYRQSI